MEPINIGRSKSLTNLSQTANYHSKKTNEPSGALKRSKSSDKIVNKKQQIFLGHSVVWLPEHKTESGAIEHSRSLNSNSTNQIVEKMNESISNVGKAEANKDKLVSKKNDFAQQIYKTNKPDFDAKNAVKSNPEMSVKHEKKFIKSGNGTLIRMKSQNSVEPSKNKIENSSKNIEGNSSKANESYVVPQHSNAARKPPDKGEKVENIRKEIKFFGHTAVWMPRAPRPEATITVPPENKKNILFVGHSCAWLPTNLEIPKDFFEKFGVQKPKIDVIEVKEKQNEAFGGKKDFKLNEMKKSSKAFNADSNRLKHDLSEKPLSSKPNPDNALTRLNNRDKNLKSLKYGQPEFKSPNKENINKAELKSLTPNNKIIDVESSNGFRKIAEKKNQDPVDSKESNPVSVAKSGTLLPSNSLQTPEPKQPFNVKAPLKDNKIVLQNAQEKIDFLGRPVKYASHSWKVLPKVSGIEGKKDHFTRKEDALKQAKLKPIEAKAKTVPEKKIVQTEPSGIEAKKAADQSNLKQTNEKTKTDIGKKMDRQPTNNLQSESEQPKQILPANNSNVQAESQIHVERSVKFLGHVCVWLDKNEIKSNETQPELEIAKDSPKAQATVNPKYLDAVKADNPEHKSGKILKINDNKSTSLKPKTDIKPIPSPYEPNELKVSESDFEFETWLNDKTLKSANKKIQAKPYKITESTAVLDKESNSIKIIPKDITKSNTQSTLTKIPINHKLDTKDMNYNVVLDPESNKLKFVWSANSKSVQDKSTGMEKNAIQSNQNKPISETEKLAKSVKSSTILPSKGESLPTTFEVALGKLNDASEKKDNLTRKAETKNAQNIKNVSQSIDHHSTGVSDPIKLTEKPLNIEPLQQRAIHEPEKTFKMVKELDPKYKISDANKKYPVSDKNKKVVANNVEIKDSTKLEKIDSATVQNKKAIEQAANDPKAGGAIPKANKSPKGISQAKTDKNINQAANVEPQKIENLAEKQRIPQKSYENKIDVKSTAKQEENKAKFGSTLSGTETSKNLDGTKPKSMKENSSVKQEEAIKVTKPLESEQLKQSKRIDVESASKQDGIKKAAEKSVLKDKNELSTNTSTGRDSSRATENKGFILIDSKNTIEKPKDNENFVPAKQFVTKNTPMDPRKADVKSSSNLKRSISDHVSAEQVQTARTRFADAKIPRIETKIKENVSAEVLSKANEKIQVQKDNLINNKNNVTEKSAAIKDAGQISHYKKQVQQEQNEMNKIIKKMESIDIQVEPKATKKIINENQTNAKKLAEQQPKPNNLKIAERTQKEPIAPKHQENKEPIAPKKQENKEPISAKKQENKEPIASKQQQNKEAIAPKKQENKEPIASKQQESKEPIASKQQESKEPIAPKKPEQLSNTCDQTEKSEPIEKKLVSTAKAKNSDKIIQQSAYAISSIVREKLNETALNLRVLDAPTKSKLNMPENIFDVTKQQDKNNNQVTGTKSFTVNVHHANNVQKKEELKEPTIVKPVSKANATKTLYKNNPLERVYKELDNKLKAAENLIQKTELKAQEVQKAAKASTIKCTLTKEQLKDLYLARKENDKVFGKVVAPDKLGSSKIPVNSKTPQETIALEADRAQNALKEDAISKPSKNLRNVYIPFSFKISQSVRKTAHSKIEHPTRDRESSNSVLNQYKSYFKTSEDTAPAVGKEKTSIFHEIKNMIKEDLFTHPTAASATTNVAAKVQIVENLGKEKNHVKLSVKEKKSENDELQLSEESCASQPYVDGKMKPLTIFQEITNMIKEDIFSVPNQSPIKAENNVKILPHEAASRQVKVDSVKSAATSGIVQIKDIPEILPAAPISKQPEIKSSEVQEIGTVQKIGAVSMDGTENSVEPVKLEKDEIKVKITNHFKPKILKPLSSNASKSTEANNDKNEKSLAPNALAIAQKESPKTIDAATDSGTSTDISKTTSPENIIQPAKVEQSTQQRPETLMEQIKYLFKVNKTEKSEQQMKNETQELMALLQVEKENSLSSKSKPKIIQEDNIKIESEKLLEPLKDDTSKPIKSNESVILSTAQKNCTNYSESPTHKLLDKNSIEFERAKLLNIPKDDYEPKTSTQSRRGSLDLNKIKEFKIPDAPPSPIIDRINRSISNSVAKDTIQLSAAENASQTVANSSNDVQKLDTNSEPLTQDNNRKHLRKMEKLPGNENFKATEIAAVNNKENLKGNLGEQKESSNENHNTPIAASVLNHLTNMNTEQSKIDQNIRLFTETEPKLDKMRISDSEAKSANFPNEKSEFIKLKATKDEPRSTTVKDLNHPTAAKKSSNVSASQSQKNKAEPIILSSTDIEKAPDSSKNKNDIETSSGNDENKKSSIVNFSRNTENNNGFDYGAGSSAIDLERNHYDAFDPFSKNQILVKILCSLKLATIKKD